MLCPACDSATVVTFADLGQVPAWCGMTFASRAEALASPRGQMTLGYCPSCVHVVNMEFDPKLIPYDSSYDNTLHCSPTFSAFATDLTGRLARTHDLTGKTVLEIGCGKGEFLTQLCQMADAWGVGYDPSYDGRSDNPRVRFVLDYLEFGRDPVPYDFLVSRHVLEHLEDPYVLLRGLREMAVGQTVPGYLEVPYARHDFAGAGWDCIYPHAGYFTAASLTRLAQRAGFTVTDVRTTFSDQFLSADITTQTLAAAENPGRADDDLRVLAHFSDRRQSAIADWRSRLASFKPDGTTAVLWGAGARGVAFLGATDPDGEIAAAVDLNPAKHDRYLPTGHQVISPGRLPQLAPDAVIITNPAYHEEISADLRRLGIAAPVVVA